MGLADKLAVQSFCFRGIKENEVVAQKAKEIGVSFIELCAVHADFTDESSFDDILKIYNDAGVGIVSIGVQQFNNEPEKERKYFEFAKKAGATTISANFQMTAMPDNFRTAEKLADEYDINLAIHNHGGKHWLGSSQALDWVLSQTSPRIGLMLDTAWALDSHEDPVAIADKFADRLYGLHIKDFTFDSAGMHKDVVVGTGNLDMPKLFETAKKNGFSGNVVLEYEGDIDNPVPALAECVQAINKIA